MNARAKANIRIVDNLLEVLQGEAIKTMTPEQLSEFHAAAAKKLLILRGEF